MHRHRKGSGSRSGIAVLFLGALLSMVMLALMSLLFAAVALRMNDPTSLTAPFSLLSLLLTAAVMGFTIAKIKGEGGVGISVLSSLLFCLILLLAGLIYTGGSLPIRIPLNYICYMGVASLSALLSKKRIGRGRHR